MCFSCRWSKAAGKPLLDRSSVISHSMYSKDSVVRLQYVPTEYQHGGVEACLLLRKLADALQMNKELASRHVVQDKIQLCQSKMSIVTRWRPQQRQPCYASG